MITFVVVDDSPLMLKMADQIIRKSVPLNDFEIVLLNSGEEALTYLDSHAVDVLLLDIVMPGIGGLEVVERLIELKRIEEMKVIMFSSLSDSTYLKSFFELGAFDYITKPINEEEFVARIKNAIHEQILQKQLKEQIDVIRNQNKELEKLNHQLKTTHMMMIQQDQLAGIGHLAAGVAHEINNPLGFVVSNFSTLQDYIERIHRFMQVLVSSSNHWEDETCVTGKDIRTWLESHKIFFDIDFMMDDMKDLLNETNDGLDRVSKIVKGLRTFSRIDAIQEFADYNINEGLENTIVVTRNELKYVAELEVTYGQLPLIHCIGGEINQTLLNLLINAIWAVKEKHAPNIGLIKIRTYRENDFACCEIIDNGIGIKEDHLKDIFKPFFTTKPVGVGTGLGLSISYDIIANKHGGKLEVISEYGKGTTMIIKLPIII